VASAVGLFCTAAALNYWLLVVASGVAGIAQGASNPVTNKVIAQEVPPAHQGMATGVNQSGVQFAVVLSGAVIPGAVATIGWRWALALLGVVTLLGAAATRARFPAGEVPGCWRAGQAAGGDEPLAGFVYRVAIYAFLLGLTAGGVIRFYPLFVQEILGYSEAGAGLAVSLAGLAAIAGRLAWARIATTRIAPRPALLVLGLGSAVAAGLLVVTELFGAWILWPTVIVIAFTVSAWNVVAMLAVLRSVPTQASGRATGVVLMGFLGGLTVAAPLVGYVIDLSGSYRPTWAALGALALAGAVTVGRLRPASQPAVGSPAAERPCEGGRPARAAGNPGTTLSPCALRSAVSLLRLPPDAQPSLRPIGRIVWSSYYCDESSQARAHGRHLVGHDRLHLPALRHRRARSLAHR
jgi:predicted MFS family arabinose efflux permease